MGVSSAVINFNNGTHGLLQVTQEYGLKEGVFCTNFCISQESNRIVETDHNLSNVQRSRESMRKGFSDEEKEEVGCLSTWNE